MLAEAVVAAVVVGVAAAGGRSGGNLAYRAWSDHCLSVTNAPVRPAPNPQPVRKAGSEGVAAPRGRGRAAGIEKNEGSFKLVRTLGHHEKRSPELLREVGEAGFNSSDFPPLVPDLSLPTAAPGPLFA